MKILYGVQGTGNGHITRARTIAREFEQTDIEVDYLFSGRPREKLFDMEPFGDFTCLPGLTFATEHGRINYRKSITCNNIPAFLSGINKLDLSNYDLVLTDFEPISAWAARRQKKPCVGMAHQYAFHYKIPTAGGNLITHAIMKYLAPVDHALGLHWHHFQQPILPPVIEPCELETTYEGDKILVYLPFEDIESTVEWLAGIDSQRFFYYCDVNKSEDRGQVHLRPFNRQAFLRDLASCNGVICSAGFGLLSESIQYGKKALVRPVKGQMEQLSNAAALKQLGYGDIIPVGRPDPAVIRRWLARPNPPPKPYPNVARAVVQWIQSGMAATPAELAQSLWSEYGEIPLDLLASSTA
jgi:uncharacterized protein (TIGR00661 family)